MAGDWIKWTKGLTRKPEVIQMAGSLKLSRYDVAARLMVFWEWCDEVIADGNAVTVTPMFIDELVSVPGFSDAMSTAKWLIARDGYIELPNFSRHNGQTAKNRVLTAIRVANHKAKGGAKGNAEGNAAGVSSALPKEEKNVLSYAREGDKKSTDGTESVVPIDALPPKDYSLRDAQAWLSANRPDLLRYADSFAELIRAVGSRDAAIAEAQQYLDQRGKIKNPFAYALPRAIERAEKASQPPRSRPTHPAMKPGKVKVRT